MHASQMHASRRDFAEFIIAAAKSRRSFESTKNCSVSSRCRCAARAVRGAPCRDLAMQAEIVEQVSLVGIQFVEKQIVMPVLE